MNICFLTKKDKLGVKEAINFTKERSKNVDVSFGDSKMPFPDKIFEKDYDILISYISPWIVPKSILEKTKKWNINLHPGPPEYPGIGCFNFALYDSSKDYGTTAHIMESKVDTGKIICVKRFTMDEKETVESLSIKTYEAQLSLYKEMMGFIFDNNCLPNISDKWKRKPFKRSELEELSTINVNMSDTEIKKRIRSTYYHGKPAPFIEICGYKFEYNPER